MYYFSNIQTVPCQPVSILRNETIHQRCHWRLANMSQRSIADEGEWTGCQSVESTICQKSKAFLEIKDVLLRPSLALC